MVVYRILFQKLKTDMTFMDISRKAFSSMGSMGFYGFITLSSKFS